MPPENLFPLLESYKIFTFFIETILITFYFISRRDICILFLTNTVILHLSLLIISVIFRSNLVKSDH